MTVILEPTPEQSAQEFFEKHYEQLLLAAYRITGNRQDAKDAVHDVYERVAPHWDTVDSPWRYITTAIAHRAGHLTRRSSMLKALLPLTFSAAPRQHAPSAEQIAELRHEAHTVQRTLMRMTQRQRTIAVMHFYFEYSPVEIAEELGISRQNVNTQITRIKTKLANALGIPASAPLHLAKEEA